MKSIFNNKATPNQGGSNHTSFMSNVNLGKDKLFTSIDKKEGDKEQATPPAFSGGNGAGDNTNQQTKPRAGGPGEENHEEKVEVYEDIPHLAGLLKLVGKTLPELREANRQLSLPREERTMFKKMSDSDNALLRPFIQAQIAVYFEVFMLQQNSNSPEALMNILGFDQKDLPFAIAIDNTVRPGDRFDNILLQMMEAKQATLNTFEEMEAFADVINSKLNFTAVDWYEEAAANFPTIWANKYHIPCAAIARVDMDKCLALLTTGASPEELLANYLLIIEIHKILNRRILSKDVKEKELAKKFEPVLNKQIDYLHMHSKNPVVVRYLAKAIDIKQELYNAFGEVTKDDPTILSLEGKNEAISGIVKSLADNASENEVVDMDTEESKDKGKKTAIA